MTTATPFIRQIRARVSWIDQNLPLPVVISAVVFLLLALVGALGRIAQPGAAAVPTAALPIILVATATPAPAQPTIAPVVQQVALVEPARYVVAFDSPNGAALGAIPAPAASAIEARYGDAWYMVTWQGAPAWIRASEIGMQIRDLAPERVIVVNAPVAAPAAPQQPVYSAPVVEPAYQVSNAEQPAQQAPAQQATAAPAPIVPSAAQPGPACCTQDPYPPLAPMEQNAATVNWAAIQYAQEHGLPMP